MSVTMSTTTTTPPRPPDTFDAAMALIEHAARLRAIATALDNYKGAVRDGLAEYDGGYGEDGSGGADAQATLFDVLVDSITAEARLLDQIGRRLEEAAEPPHALVAWLEEQA